MPERKPEQEKEVLEWIQAVMEEPLPQGEFEEVIHYIVLYFCYLLQQFSTYTGLEAYVPAHLTSMAKLIK